jgi:DNA replication and repair protein RecF
MKVLSLRVQNFRNHDDVTCKLSSTTTLVYGKNGSGKTALIEALYEAYRGVSFRGGDDDILKTAHRWYRVDVVDDAMKRTVLFDNRNDLRSKQFVVDGKKSVRLPARYKLPVILFTPDDLQLIGGSPARRRKYLDTVISQYDTGYAQALRRYERAVHQRNALLKRPDTTKDLLFSWDVLLSQNGAYIITARLQLMQRINDNLQRHYVDIAGVESTLEASYTHTVSSAPALLAHYQASFERDRSASATSVGPHRHDFTIRLNNKMASDSASRGEVRTIVLALKYIEADIVHQCFTQYPLVLLDDVFGELDDTRQKNLLTFFANNQVVITSTYKHKAGARVLLG